MIFTLRDLIPHSSNAAQLPTGQWVRAMHLPFSGGLLDRFRDARAVFSGTAVAVKWPTDGEYEQAIALADRELSRHD